MAARSVTHIGIAVPNLEQAIDFLTEVFQLETAPQRPEVDVRNMYISIGGLSIQLVEDAGRLGDDTFGRLDHLAVEVDDVDETAALLEAAGAKVAWDAPRTVRSRRSQFTTGEGSLGVVFQLTDSLGDVKPGKPFTNGDLEALARR